MTQYLVFYSIFIYLFVYLYLHPIDHMGQPHLDIGIVNKSIFFFFNFLLSMLHYL